MSVFARFKAIFEAGASGLAESVDDPKVSLDYSLMKLEEGRGQVNRSLVEVSAAKRRLENQRDQLRSMIDKYQTQAQSALDADREDLARTAVERRQEALSRAEELDANLNTLERQLEALKESQANLERKVALFRAKREELKAVYDASRAQVRLREAVTGISTDLTQVGLTIQRAETRIREMQSRAEAIEGLVAEGILTDMIEPEHDDIDRELGRISRQQAVEEELARLKSGAARESA